MKDRERDYYYQTRQLSADWNINKKVILNTRALCNQISCNNRSMHQDYFQYKYNVVYHFDWRQSSCIDNILQEKTSSCTWLYFIWGAWDAWLNARQLRSCNCTCFGGPSSSLAYPMNTHTPLIEYCLLLWRWSQSGREFNWNVLTWHCSTEYKYCIVISYNCLDVSVSQTIYRGIFTNMYLVKLCLYRFE